MRTRCGRSARLGATGRGCGWSALTTPDPTPDQVPDRGASPRSLAELALEAARLAGAELMRRAGTVTGLGMKSSATDPVSDADRAAEALLTRTLLAARPDDRLVGEEGTRHAGTSGLHWLVDPLDGTVNYLYGFPGWCVSVACCDAAGALAGCVYDPVREEAFVATRGEGAQLNGRTLAVNEPVTLDRALVATGFSYVPAQRRRQAATLAALLPRVRDIRRAGSAALDLCWLAAGRVDAYYEDSLGEWDWAAGALVATEAGATVTPLPPGSAGAGGSGGVLAAGPSLHAALRPLV